MDTSDSTFIRHYDHLITSREFQEEHRKAYRQGYEIGLKLGRVENARKVLLQIGTLLLGTPNPAIKRHIRTNNDELHLNQLILQCLDAKQWAELITSAN